MRRVLVSVHDVTPRHFDRLRAIDALLRRHGLAGRYAALIVPNFWHEWPLADHPSSSSSSAPASTRASSRPPRLLPPGRRLAPRPGRRLRGQALTAGEGEFLGLDREAARARIVAGQRLLRDHLGVTPEVFVAPAWLYSEGSLDALTELGVAVAEDHLRVWSPARGGEVLARGPVLSYASRSPARIAASLLWSRATTALAGPLPILRLAIHPHDLDVPALERELDRALEVIVRERAPMRYAELVA
ncbi:MAG: hypothetical protein R3A79_23265 [Nannocystaceae bacterium]